VSADRNVGLLAASGADARQLDDFGRGLCHVLALALHQRAGLPLRALGRPADEFSIRPLCGLTGAPRHVYVLNDSGLPLDIHGVFRSEEAVRAFFARDDEEHEPLTSVSFCADMITGGVLWEHGYSRCTANDLEIAAKVIDRLGLLDL
jgi:hypothetical protein